MITVLLVNITSLIFSILSSISKNRFYLKMSIFIVFCFLAIRYNYGNDYINYQYIFESINDDQNTLKEFSNKTNIEIGYVFLNKILGYLGFPFIIAFISLISSIGIYKLISIYSIKSYYWLSIFIYLFNYNLLLIHITAIRQLLAIIVFYISIKFLIDRNLIKYLICIIIASLFHKSALLLLPFYWIITPNIITIKYKMVMIGLFIFITTFSILLLPTIYQLLQLYFPRYITYIDTGNTTPINSGLGIVSNIFIFLNILYFIKDEDGKYAIILKICLLLFAFSLIGLQIDQMNRFLFYLEPSLIISLPIIIMNIKSRYYRNTFILFILFRYTYSFFKFFQDPIWIKSYSNYTTIFELF